MANPNIVNVATIYGNTSVLAVGATAANVVQNPASSNTLYKINSLQVTNSNTGVVTLTHELNQAGTNTAIGRSISIPPGATIVLIGKDTGIYLLENWSIQLTASAATSITAVCSYEQIS